MTNTPNAAETSRKLNILLTEDNMVNRVLAQKLLLKFGHRVILANNGKEGATLWEANQAGQFDVILMDIQMPPDEWLTGYGLHPRQRSRPAN